MKILIISSFFPPQNSIASLRPYSWAKYWSRAGHDVTVVTIPKKETPIDLKMDLHGFQVLTVPIPGMDWVRKRINPNEEHTQKTSNLEPQLLPEKTFSVRKIIKNALLQIQKKYGIFSACRMPDVLDFWSKPVLKKLGSQEWDLVISTSGPYGVHAPAYTLRSFGLAKRWIADWRDPWVDNHIYSGLAGFRIIENILEKRWCNAADMLTTVSEPLALNLRKKYGDKVEVIYNGFDPEDYSDIPEGNIFEGGARFNIVYTGSLYAGFRDPSPLFSAIANLDKQKKISPDIIQMIFCGANADPSNIAKSLGVEKYVKYEGVLPRGKALQMQRDATALVLLEFESKETRGILTGKMFEYLFAGPKILGIGIDGDSSIGTVLKETGRGVAFGTDAELIQRELEELLDNGARSDSNFKDKESKIYFYSRENQANRLLKHL